MAPAERRLVRNVRHIRGVARCDVVTSSAWTRSDLWMVLFTEAGSSTPLLVNSRDEEGHPRGKIVSRDTIPLGIVGSQISTR